MNHMGLLETKYRKLHRKVNPYDRSKDDDHDRYCHFLATIFFPHLTMYGPTLIKELLSQNRNIPV